MAEPVVFNHLGHCVTDVDKARRFYEGLLKFQFLRELSPPDELSAKLLRLEPPLGMTVTYLQRDGLILELLHFAQGSHPPFRARLMNEPGLTHVSLSVDDVDAVLTEVGEYGGIVLEDSNIGSGVFIRDPDGQLIELLPMSYRTRQN